MSNQARNFNPRNFKVQIANYEILGFSAKEDAITISGMEKFSSLSQGMDVTTTTFTANVTMSVNLKLNSGSPSNSVIQAFAAARYFAGTANLPEEITTPASGLLSDIPFTMYAHKDGVPSFVLATKAWTITNMADLNVPYKATENLDREWNIELTFEPQDLMGALVTL